MVDNVAAQPINGTENMKDIMSMGEKLLQHLRCWFKFLQISKLVWIWLSVLRINLILNKDSDWKGCGLAKGLKFFLLIIIMLVCFFLWPKITVVVGGTF